MKSVQSFNPCTSVIQTKFDSIKAHGEYIRVESKEARPDDSVGRGEGTTMIIHLRAS